MSQVQINLDELEAFIRALRVFDANLSSNWAQLKARWLSLRDAWRDPKCAQFLDAGGWQQVINSIERYLNEAEQYVRYLEQKAAPLRQYSGASAAVASGVAAVASGAGIAAASAKATQAGGASFVAPHGFEKSGVMSNESVKQFLTDTLPSAHLNPATLTKLQYDDTFQGDAQGNTTLGVTKHNGLSGKNEITIYRQSPAGSFNESEMKYTVTHEVGHNVYWNLSSDQKKEWSRICAADRYAGQDKVSDYAWTNIREDFAESYAHYVLDPVKLFDVSPAKYQFIQDFVFGGRRY